MVMSGARGRDLSAASRAEMMKRQTPAGGDAYGLGFFFATDARGNHFVEHDGGVAGYTSQIVFHPESRTGVVLLRNYDVGRTNLQKAAESLLSAIVTPPK
jgi:CubicO group peptidase (beta-lactamase class C family)